jgi:colanic acid/amylovoran biosynthesis glycosyltransferase
MTSRISIGYLIPEFPAQTHNFFWNERSELFKLGIDTCLLSTRRPPETLVSHSWAGMAQKETVYLAEISTKDAAGIFFEWIRLGPRAWLKALVASTDG